jgi:YbbR domain-containing protein
MLEIPVEYMNRDSEMKIIETSVNSVRINLSGSGALIKSIRPDQVKVRLDLSKAVVGITVPPGVVLKNIKPSVVEVTLDIPTKKALLVQVDWVGKLSERLILKGARVDPEKIEVIGGKRILKNMSTIYTEKVPLDKIEKSGKITVKPAHNPAILEIASELENGITIQYQIEKRPQ